MRTRNLLVFVALVLVSAPNCDKPAAPERYSFERTYGGPDSDFACSVQQTADGGYIIGGGTIFAYPRNEACFLLVKTDARGDTEWTRAYGDSSLDHCRSVRRTGDGGYIAVGTRGPGYNGIRVVKTDSAGDTTWTRVYGDTGECEGCAIEPTRDGGFIILGAASTPETWGSDFLFVRTDAAGDTLWTALVAGDHDQRAGAVLQTTDGGFIAAGSTDGGEDCYIVKLDAYGTLEWVSDFGGEEADWLESVHQTADRGYIAVGSTYCTPDGNADIFLVKLNADGDTLWTRRYGGYYDEIGYSVDVAEDGGFSVAGSTESFGAGGTDAYIVRTDAAGDTLWTKTFGGTGYESFSSVCCADDSGFVAVGATDREGAGGQDIYVIKTNADGRVGSGGQSYPTH